MKIDSPAEWRWTFADFAPERLDVSGPRLYPRVAVRKRPIDRLISATMNVKKEMKLNRQVCSRARLSRDPRFDGKFFIGVRGSGVYCRSICPAPTAKEKNVRYFETAAAAAEAGFRPCLRCRPECSPGTPAWCGTSNTVSRALRLIAESGLEDGGVEALAERLGVGSRHLRRLFLKHLGATPSAVAHTRRLHFAKKLIDETQLPMSHVAIAAGFGCVRRFNAAMQKVYKRTPTHIRKLARPAANKAENQYSFQLRFRPPYYWDGMLSFLTKRAIPGVEAVEHGVYRRTISLKGEPGYFEVSGNEATHALAVGIQFSDPCLLFLIIERIRAMFDLNADWTDIARTLKNDPALAGPIRHTPGLRIPGCWDGFELAVRAIVGQQISVAAATALAGRVARTFGKPCPQAEQLTHLFPPPAILAEADLTKAGLTRSRAESVRALARAVSSGEIRFEGITDSEDFLARLCGIPGIGKWTAQYVAMRALGETDALPTGDLGLLKTLALTNSHALEERSQAWRPWRAYATVYLWNGHSRSMSANYKPKGIRQAEEHSG
jgi:AraC family transcriptional regulator of adaptative response / DNA-3-methyladenine glycosylase II